jgi:hypothetical protein
MSALNFPVYLTEMMSFPDKKVSVLIQLNTRIPQNLGKSNATMALEMFEEIGK